MPGRKQCFQQTKNNHKTMLRVLSDPELAWSEVHFMSLRRPFKTPKQWVLLELVRDTTACTIGLFSTYASLGSTVSSTGMVPEMLLPLRFSVLHGARKIKSQQRVSDTALEHWHGSTIASILLQVIVLRTRMPWVRQDALIVVLFVAGTCSIRKGYWLCVAVLVVHMHGR